MQAHAEVNGRKVSYETTGEGEPVVVIGDPGRTADFGLLNDWFQLLAPDWLGRVARRGAAADRTAESAASAEPTRFTEEPTKFIASTEAAGPLGIVTAFIEHLGRSPVRVIGWGEGVQTALRLAMERPDLVRQLAVIGPLPACDGLPYRTRVATLATMTAPLLVLRGDDGALDVAHSAALTRTVPDGRLAVLPGPSRLLPEARSELVGLILLDFFGSVGVPVARTA
jgi:pimeloyl-ACP methyl ester carboxylesterase